MTIFTRDHFKRNIFNYLGTILGILGLLSGVYFYLLSKQYYEPVLSVEHERVEIVKPNSKDTTLFKVIKADGSMLRNGLYAAKVLFWNNGNKSLKRENILEGLKIVFLDSGEILAVREIGQSRDVTELTFLPDSANPKREVNINFRIMEGGDGGIAQIIYEGDRHSRFKVIGLIEGVPEIRRDPPTSIRIALLKASKSIGVIFLCFFGIICFGGVGAFFDKAPKGSLKDKIFKTLIYTAFGIFIFTICILGPIAFVIDLVKESKEKYKSEMIERLTPSK